MNLPRRARPSLGTAQRLATSLGNTLSGRAIDRLWRPAHDQLLLRFSGRDKRRLWIDLDGDRPRWTLTMEWPENPDRPDDQTLRLRGGLEGWRVEGVELVNERALEMRLSRGEGRRTLRLQLAGRYLNTSVRGDGLDDTIALLRDRPSVDEDSPPLRPGEDPESALDDDGWLRAAEVRWRTEAAWLAFAREQTDLRRLTRDALKKVKRALTKIGRDLERAQGAEENRRRGDMLKTVLGRIAPGATEIEAIDYSAPDCPTVRIELDPSIDAVSNMKRYYRLYRRFNDARSDIEARHAESKERHDQLEGLLEKLSGIDSETPDASLARLQELREEARRFGVRARTAQRAGRRAAPAALPYRTFLSAHGERILVGRSAKHNDALTFRVARGRDLWLHTRDVSGSHVVIPLERGAEPSHETLLDAAHLALHFSQARGEPAGDVQWTHRKHIRRVSGAGPGRVTVANSRTIRITFDPERLEQLYGRDEVREQ